jgi:hypothetical protein
MGKNQDPGYGINIPDPPHWVKGTIPRVEYFAVRDYVVKIAA